MPKLSICVLAHNNALHLPFALESIRAQSFEDWECIISDDASTDGTPAVVEPLLRADQRFRMVRHEQNLGQPANWAFALGRAEGDFVTTLHADDAYEPGAFREYLAAFVGGGRQLVWANWGYFNESLSTCRRLGPVEDLRLEGDAILQWFVRNNHTIPSTTAFSRSLLQKSGVPTDRCGIFCDRDYFLRLAADADAAKAIGRMLVRYRQHGKSVTANSTFSGLLQSDMVKLGLTAGIRFSDRPDLARVLRRQCGGTILSSAWDTILRGNFQPGFRWAADAVRLSGGLLAHPSVMISLARVTKTRVCSFVR